MRYSSVAAAALHAMLCMPVHESVPEKNRGCYAEHINHDCAFSCESLGRLCRACHVPLKYQPINVGSRLDLDPQHQAVLLPFARLTLAHLE